MKTLAWMAALLLVTAVPAGATIVKSLSLDDLAREADVVVHGVVEAQEATWNETRSRIYTVTRVRVVDSLKGPAKADETLSIRQIGGSLDGLTQTIVGNAKLRKGEEVVLFLDRDEERGLHYVVGMAQGKYAVDRSGDAPRVVRDLDGLALAEVEGKKLARLEDETPRPSAAPTLDVFKEQIRASLRR